MTVEDLIRELQKHPADTKVYVRGYEDGVDDVDSVDAVDVHRDVNTEAYFGRHEIHEDYRSYDTEPAPGLWLRTTR